MAWHDGAILLLARQKRPEEPLASPLCVKMIFYHGDLTRRDSDNEATSILDLLKDTRIIADDNWKIIRQIQIENRYEKNAARCEILLSDYKKKE